TPILAPLITVTSATYGQTTRGLRDRVAFVESQLFAIMDVQKRKEAGLLVTAEQNARCRQLDSLIAESETLGERRPRYVIVTQELQRIVDRLGGGTLELSRTEEDLNRRFGNPDPGQPKELRVEYQVAGHDSERTTSSDEVLPSGFQCNFILPRKGSSIIQ
ncbi:unnamed protein product, partial [Phaeothamnion confervicola]